jgi:acyl-coenzyme A synthetase/AMP-(fatty) acid ligase
MIALHLALPRTLAGKIRKFKLREMARAFAPGQD